MGKLTNAVGFLERQAGSRRRISPRWQQVWLLAVGYRMLRNFLAEEPEVIRETVGPGQKLVITHYAKGDEPPPPPPEPSRRERRRQAKDEARAAKAEKQAAKVRKQEARKKESRAAKKQAKAAHRADTVS